MLKRLKAWVKGFLGIKEGFAPYKGLGAFGIPLEHQVRKRTHYKPGEHYRVGEGKATVHADEASMLRALAFTEYTRMKKEERLTERGIDLMLMTPEELQKIKINEFLEKRQQQRSYLSKLMEKMFPTNLEELKKAPLPAPIKAVEQTKEEVKVKEKAEDKELVKV